MALINTLNDIGDAVREKTGGTELIPLKEMATAILSIQGGAVESVEYSSIVYNDDGTITLIQTNGTVHTMTCEYEDGKLVSLKYGDKAIDLTYDNDVLVGIDGMSVDVSKAPATNGGGLDQTITFIVEGEPYEIVSVKNGNLINAPVTTPTIENGTFKSWQINGEDVVFPYLPTSDVEITALIPKVRSEVELNNAGDLVCVVGAETVTKSNDGWSVIGYAYGGSRYRFFLVGETPESVATSYSSNDREFEYNGKTYYYNQGASYQGSPTDFGKAVKLTYNADYSIIAKSLLDYYFMVG